MGKINNIKKYLLISVKPEFAGKIISKEKCIELRKVKPHVQSGDYIIIYASSPVKCVVGWGVVKRIIEEHPLKIWEHYSDKLGIDRGRFDDYYINCERSIGIEIESIHKLTPISLSKLRTLDAKFHPPQTYRYVSNIQICRIIKGIASRT